MRGNLYNAGLGVSTPWTLILYFRFSFFQISKQVCKQIQQHNKSIDECTRVVEALSLEEIQLQPYLPTWILNISPTRNYLILAAKVNNLARG